MSAVHRLAGGVEWGATEFIGFVDVHSRPDEQAHHLRVAATARAAGKTLDDRAGAAPRLRRYSTIRRYRRDCSSEWVTVVSRLRPAPARMSCWTIEDSLPTR